MRTNSQIPVHPEVTPTTKSAAVLALLLCAAGLNAATTTLYQTGWEAAPASPSWTVGELVPQNNWNNENSTAGHQIVANGSQGGIVTPFGTQFHKFTASPNTATHLSRLAWVDLTTSFAGRPAGQSIIKSSIDVYVPASQAAVPALYGIAAYHGLELPWGILFNPSDRSVYAVVDDAIPHSAPAAFAYDTWFNLTVSANYNTGEIRFDVNGVNHPELTGTSTGIFSGALNDVDLFAENYIPSAPTVRIAYSDNFRVTAGDGVEPRPALSVAAGVPGQWHLTWSAAFSNWILESTQNIESPSWSTEGVTPNISGGIASVDRPNSPPRRFYRLRKP